MKAMLPPIRINPAATVPPHPNALVDQGLLRGLAAAFLVAHLAAAIAAALSLVMLQGDGSWFVYTLTLDAPWVLKWQAIAARATVYLATVVPTQAIAHLFDLGPLAIARVNGFLFFGLPGGLFALGARLVWRDRPDLLYFLIVQSLTGFALCFGFPSEILIAPGMLWIALFLATRTGISMPFMLAYSALVFCHELALPAALVTATFTWHRAGRKAAWCSAPSLLTVAALASPIVAMLTVRMAGGGTGSNSNAIFVLDPRRILNNPTLWLVFALLLPTLLAGLVRPRWRSGLGLCLCAGSAFLICIIAQALVPALNFADGRYDARSVVALSMLVLSLIHTRREMAQARRETAPPSQMPDRHATNGRFVWSLPFIGMTSGVTLAATTCFLADWTTATQGLRQIVVPSLAARSTGALEFVSFHDALRLMSSAQATANRRMGFQWVYPYRSMILANGGAPRRIVIGDGHYERFCKQSAALVPEANPYPPAVQRQWRTFTCHYVPPRPRDTVSKRLLKMFRRPVP
jgi:hypothetical protein